MIGHRLSIPGMRKFFSLPRSVQNGSAAPPANPVATDSSSLRTTGGAVKLSPRSTVGVKNGRSKRLPQTPINLHGTMYHTQTQFNLHVYPGDDGKTRTEALLSTYQTKRCHNSNITTQNQEFIASCCHVAPLLACNFKFAEKNRSW